MPSTVNRLTVDLSGYPDLVVIYLGMRVNSLRGLKSLMMLRGPIQQSVAAQPDGLLLHEDLIFSVFPLHLGMRQYWRDFDALESWSRQLPHQEWWRQFLRDSGGTGFWHETYFRRGGIEAIYDDVPVGVGLSAFAPGFPLTVRCFRRAIGEDSVARLRRRQPDPTQRMLPSEKYFAS